MEKGTAAPEEKEAPACGLVLVHTGDGKGKTTAALGLALRAWGDGLRVLVLQFIKHGGDYGERRALAALAAVDGRMELRACGRGFTTRGSLPPEEHRRAAEAALAEARAAITGGGYDLIVLDEINYAVKFGLLRVVDVLALLDVRPPSLHLVLTGRDAAPELIARADLVTEMRLVKHPYQRGIKAQRGIEF